MGKMLRLNPHTCIAYPYRHAVLVQTGGNGDKAVPRRERYGIVNQVFKKQQQLSLLRQDKCLVFQFFHPQFYTGYAGLRFIIVTDLGQQAVYFY